MKKLPYLTLYFVVKPKANPEEKLCFVNTWIMLEGAFPIVD